MESQYVFFLTVLLLVGQTAMTGISSRDKHSQNAQTTGQRQVVTVQYCDLVKNQVKYAEKLIRVRTAVLGWLDGSSLYDSKCSDQGLEPVFDCEDDEKCSAMAKRLQKDTDFRGDVERVEAVLIGKLVLPDRTVPGRSRSKFIIKEIERTKRIERKVPWPGVRPSP